jgi:hypothetical protein
MWIVLRAHDRIHQQATHLFVKRVALVRPIQCDVEDSFLPFNQ